MIQSTFFALLVIALLAGVFAYFIPQQKSMDPITLMMKDSGLGPEEVLNHKKTQQLNMITSRGLVQVRRQMDELAQEQNKFLNTIRDQQQVLNNTSKDAYDILMAAQQANVPLHKDILQLKALTSQMQDQQRLLVSHGQDLIVLNDQLTKDRQWVADQVNSANINTETPLNALQQRYSMLKDQAAGFFDKVTQHNQEVQDSIDKIQDKLHDLTDNASTAQQQSIKDKVQRMLDKEHEDMIMLAANEERSKDLLKDAQEKLADSKDQSNDSLQRSKDLIEQERQKQEDQRAINQQHIADELQRMQDQRNR